MLNVDDSIAVMISQDGKNALICSQSRNKYIPSALDDVSPDMMIADVKGGSSPGVLSVIKESKPERLIVPKVDGSLTSVLPNDKITKTANAQINLFKNTSVEFVSNQHFSVAYCTAQDVTVCILLRADNIENVPEEYLVGDVFIGAKLYDETEFDNVVISGETDENGLISTEEFGSIDIKIKDNNCKIIVEEG